MNATLHVTIPTVPPDGRSADVLLVRLFERDKQQEWAAVVATKDRAIEDINGDVVKFAGEMIHKALLT